MLYAKKIAQGKGVIIPDEAKANSAAMSAWIDSNRGTKRKGPRRRDRRESAEARLREKLRKIDALFSGAGTAGS
jgi:DNA topoisomerase-3